MCEKCGFKIKRQVQDVSVSCQCRFHWCCKVECNKCWAKRTKLTCVLSRWKKNLYISSRFPDISWHFLTYPDIFWHFLTFSDISWQVQDVSVSCQCRFHWCCKVECNKCWAKRTKLTCVLPRWKTKQIYIFRILQEL